LRAIERRIDYPGRGEWLTLYPLFDLHTGTRRCNETKLRRVVAEIAADPLAYWLYGGDGGEFINRKDPRHKESDLAPWLHGVDDLARAQVEYLKDLLVPIAPKCLAVLSGNHEAQMLKHHERNVYAEILTAIKDAAGHRGPLGLGYRGFVRLRCQRSTHAITTLTICAEHGFGGGRLKGADALQLGRAFMAYACDVYLVGHRHHAMVTPHAVQQVRGQRVRTIHKLAAMVGTFRESDTPHDETDPGDYGDMANYPPADIAGVRVRFQPDEFALRGEVYAY
jgi:hypothetical protein